MQDSSIASKCFSPLLIRRISSNFLMWAFSSLVESSLLYSLFGSIFSLAICLSLLPFFYFLPFLAKALCMPSFWLLGKVDVINIPSLTNALPFKDGSHLLFLLFLFFFLHLFWPWQNLKRMMRGRWCLFFLGKRVGARLAQEAIFCLSSLI